MEINPLQRQVKAEDVLPERLAGNSHLTEQQKIGEASRQFEAMLLKQILENTQKTVIQSKFADNSTSSEIYRGMVTTQLADSISKSGGFGLASTFEKQLNRSSAAAPEALPASHTGAAAPPQTPFQPQVMNAKHRVHPHKPVSSVNAHE